MRWGLGCQHMAIENDVHAPALAKYLKKLSLGNHYFPKLGDNGLSGCSRFQRRFDTFPLTLSFFAPLLCHDTQVEEVGDSVLVNI